MITPTTVNTSITVKEGGDRRRGTEAAEQNRTNKAARAAADPKAHKQDDIGFYPISGRFGPFVGRFVGSLWACSRFVLTESDGLVIQPTVSFLDTRQITTWCAKCTSRYELSGSRRSKRVFFLLLFRINPVVTEYPWHTCGANRKITGHLKMM